MNSLALVTLVSASILTGCGQSGPTTAPGERAASKSPESASRTDATVAVPSANSAPKPVEGPSAMTAPKPPARPALEPKPDGPIVPSPVQPPAEVQPAHRSPGDKVDPGQ